MSVRSETMIAMAIHDHGFAHDHGWPTSLSHAATGSSALDAGTIRPTPAHMSERHRPPPAAIGQDVSDRIRPPLDMSTGAVDLAAMLA
jgi:hypothetical protein